MNLKIQGNQRIFFVGKTQSGKSYLARLLLKKARSQGWRIVIVDPKRDWVKRGKFKYGVRKDKGSIDAPILISVFDPSLYVQIIHPVEWDEETRNLCLDIMKQGNTIVYFDEITQLIPSTHIPKELLILWTQGASIGIGSWAGNQRPKDLPMQLKDQAETWIIFRIANKNDRKSIAGFIPTDDVPQLIEKPLPYRYFWFYNDKMDKPLLMKPISI